MFQDVILLWISHFHMRPTFMFRKQTKNNIKLVRKMTATIWREFGKVIKYVVYCVCPTHKTFVDTIKVLFTEHSRTRLQTN
jgi:hypothetical protein